MDIVALNQIVSQALAILQEQIDFHKKRAAKLKHDTLPGASAREKLHIQTAEKFLLVVKGYMLAP